MIKLRFEYKIVFAYLLAGVIWIVFSDQLLGSLINDVEIITKIQTYKGWFYVVITALLFFLFLKKHLTILRETVMNLGSHKKNLQQLVVEKTKDLDFAIAELKLKNEQLAEKNEIINSQNSDLKEALRDLKNMHAQLLQADKMASIGILTSGIAHEINNPLNYILGGLTGLEQYFEKKNTNDQKISLYLDSIKTGIDRVNSIVSGLSQLSRNKDSYEEPCDIHQIIENCLTIISNQTKNRINIVKEYLENNLVIKGNVGQFHQIILNILINASQAIEKEGTINIGTKTENENVIIEISDTGCGIKKEDISKITDPFFTTKAPGEGTGLGLSITYNLIRAHQGSLQFQSEINKGTTVKITLPNKNNKDA